MWDEKTRTFIRTEQELDEVEKFMEEIREESERQENIDAIKFHKRFCELIQIKNQRKFKKGEKEELELYYLSETRQGYLMWKGKIGYGKILQDIIKESSGN